MTEQEINRTIAELLGYETPYEQLPQDRAPLWATDTDAALMLLEALPKYTYRVSYSTRYDAGKEQWIHQCGIYCMTPYRVYGGKDEEPTLAIAICKAWIAYKQAETAQP